MIGISIMKELKENLKSNLKFKFQKFGWPGDLRVKIDKNYHYTKQGKIFVLVTEIDTSFSLLLEPTLFFCEICKIMLSNMKNCELNCKHLIPNNRKNYTNKYIRVLVFIIYWFFVHNNVFLSNENKLHEKDPNTRTHYLTTIFL